jgi:hypothetical protein
MKRSAVLCDGMCNKEKLLRSTSILTLSCFFMVNNYTHCKPGSSVSIVSGYGLDDRAIDVRSPAEAKGFFLQPLCPDRL